MKCLFLYKTASLDITDPVGIMCLMATVKKAGHQAELFLTNLEKKPVQVDTRVSTGRHCLFG